jgi:plastocyanin
MSRSRQLALLLLVPIVGVAGVLVGRSLIDSDPPADSIGVERADDETAFEHEYVIPLGTADRIDAGDEIEIVPAELVVRVGEAIRIVNDDTADHTVGVFYVAAGETMTQRFSRAGVLEGKCSVHPSGAFTLRVEA